MATTSIEALTTQINNLLLKAQTLEDEIIEAEDESTVTALNNRLQRCYAIINQKNALLQSFRGGKEVGGVLTPPVSPKPETKITPVADDEKGGRVRDDEDLGKWSVFMSYCWQNSQEAAEMGQIASSSDCGPCDPRKLARDLSDAGYITWLDVDRLGDGEPLYEELVKGILPAKCVIACVSAAYIESRNCNLEFKYVHNLKIPLILIVVGNLTCDWKRSTIGFMAGDTLYIETITQPYQTTLHRIKQALSRHILPTSPTNLEPSPTDPLETLTALAESGDASSQFKLALTLDPNFGDDPTRSWEAAARWYLQAAEQGHVDAQCNLAGFYWEGKGVEESVEEGVKWYRAAAQQGDEGAQVYLGERYRLGEAVEKDLGEAVRWYRMAAEQGSKDGEYGLGECYHSGGDGVEVDEGEAFGWYLKAAEQGHAEAQLEVGYCYQHGSGVEKDESEGVKWFQKAAEQGLGYAQVALGACYMNGLGIEKDPEEAVKWFRKAAEEGHALGQSYLGHCYGHGFGVEEDAEQAVIWLGKAAEQGDEYGKDRLQQLLGRLRRGEEVQEKPKSSGALAWMMKRAAKFVLGTERAGDEDPLPAAPQNLYGPYQHVQVAYQPQEIPDDESESATEAQRWGTFTKSGGRRRALLIGINYTGTNAQLQGCHNDVEKVREWLVKNYPFAEDEIRVLLDTEGQSEELVPTRHNIEESMRWLVEGAQAGDAFFFHYSGHGSQAKDTHGDEHDGIDETVVPLDYQTAGQIHDDTCSQEINSILVHPLPRSSRLTAIFDCCHSGSIMDLPYTYSVNDSSEIVVRDNTKAMFIHALKAGKAFFKGDSEIFRDHAKEIIRWYRGEGEEEGQGKGEAENDGDGLSQVKQKVMEEKGSEAFIVQFAGCRDNQTSADAHIENEATGAMSWALLQTLEDNHHRLTYMDVLSQTRALLAGKYKQVPQMSTAAKVDVGSTMFSII
ncbi:Ca(2+)-dependent cysteine protease [Rhizophlyctis rosea]|uniref:Ca(2+)-dependent cysteine protease n=1 Tax=Rhizophlyctis rosea TaxID=64517 RepID=A0AAD5X2V8_9FUNG|nr:Ca(2+)-dependent cysteine protease [Rhizophlyctis rosea]